jgi:ABC-type multidrug transport system fused ATPase/permease subunit
MSAAGASQSVFDYLDRKPLQRPSGLLEPKEFRGEIEFNNVSLVYPARPTEIAVQVNRFTVVLY